MKKINFPLLIGSIILIFFIIVSFWPTGFTPKDPLLEESVGNIEYKVDGQWVEELAHNPKRPNKENLLGTDDAGRDVYARLVYGTRNTLRLAFLVAIFRMLIALPLGIAAGMGSKIVSSIIRVFNNLFTAIPMLIFSFIILNLQYFRYMSMNKSIISFTIVLTLLGWAKLASMIEDSTRLVMEEDFIEGEIAIGKTKWQIAGQNILPHIIPTSISLFFKEMSMALFLIAQLAVLGIFVGSMRDIQEMSFITNYEMALEPEWGSCLARIAIDVKAYGAVYWVVLYPVLIFTIATVGINLVGEGLKLELQRRDSRIISSMRKILITISPKAYVHQIMNVKDYYKPVIIKTLVIISIVVYIAVPWNPSLYKFNIDNAKAHIDELTKSKYQGRVPGSEGGYLAGDYIINNLTSYGYDVETSDIPIAKGPYSNEEGVQPQVASPTIIKSGTITLKNKIGEKKTYELHKDFFIITVDSKTFSNYEDTTKQLTYEGFAADEAHVKNVPKGGTLFPIEKTFEAFDDSLVIDNMGNKKLRKAPNSGENIKFVLLEDYNRQSNAHIYDATTIMPVGEMQDEMGMGYEEVEIKLDFPQIAKHQGRNIIAFLPGKDKTKENPGEVIMIGASYDGTYAGEDREQYSLLATPSAILLEIARSLSEMKEPLDKTIQFIFWDNETENWSCSFNKGSYHYGTVQGKGTNAAAHGYYYFDIGYPGYEEDKKLDVTTLPSENFHKRNYPMILELDKRLRQLGIKNERLNQNYQISRALEQLRLNADSSLSVGTFPSMKYNNEYDKKENLNYKNIHNIGQIIIDTLTMNNHVMD